jgi:hypothetical protein
MTAVFAKAEIDFLDDDRSCVRTTGTWRGQADWNAAALGTIIHFLRPFRGQRSR